MSTAAGPMAESGAPPPEPAAPSPTASPEASLGPVRVGGGKVIEILEEGLRTTTRTGFACFSAHSVHITSWDDFRRCDVETFCFSGTVTLAQADGDSLTLKVPLRKIRDVATAIYKKINMGRHGRVKPEVSKLLGKKPKALIFGSGLVLVRSRGFCKRASTFVPWEAVVSLSLRPGCFRSHIKVRTLLEEHVAEPARGRASTSDGKAGASETDALVQPGDDKASPDGQPEEHAGPHYLEVDIKGKADAMEQVFAALLELMNGGTAPQPLPDDAQVPGTSLTTLGLITTHRSVRSVLPWSSIAAVDLQVSLFAPKLVLTDCTGMETALRKVVPGEFDTVRAQIAKAKGTTGPSAAMAVKPIVRRNIKMTGDGLSLMTRHFCSATTQFIAWQKIDAFEMASHCFGGTLVLITETGQRIPVCRAGLFGQKAMNELANRIQDMKYGKSSHEATRVFAGREGDRRACLLTNSSVRLVASKGLCSRLIRILDLDSVNGCQAANPRKLLFSLRESMGIDGDDEKPGVQPLEVNLRRNDDANDLAADVMRRAHARKHSSA